MASALTIPLAKSSAYTVKPKRPSAFPTRSPSNVAACRSATGAAQNSAPSTNAIAALDVRNEPRSPSGMRLAPISHEPR